MAVQKIMKTIDDSNCMKNQMLDFKSWSRSSSTFRPAHSDFAIV